MTGPYGPGNPDPARVQAYLGDVASAMAEHGYTLQAVFGSRPGDAFTYTVGLTGVGLPELWLGTLAPEQAGAILRELVDRIREAHPTGGSLEPGPIDAGFTVGFRLRGPVDPVEAQVGLARQMHPLSEVSVMQVLWPDDAGRFPDEAAYDAGRFPQRLLPVLDS